MINTLRQHKTKTRQAKLLHDRIEEMELKIKLLLTDEDEDVKGYEGALKKTIKGNPNVLQQEALDSIKEIKDLRSGILSKYIDQVKPKNTTKSKK